MSDLVKCHINKIDKPIKGYKHSFLFMDETSHFNDEALAEWFATASQSKEAKEAKKKLGLVEPNKTKGE